MSRTTFFEVEVLDAKTRKQLCFLDKVEPCSTVGDIKSLFHKTYPHWYPSRQALKLDPKGKSLRDDEVLQNLPVGTTATMYVRDLGPQLGWTMVFLAEYVGPLLTYLLFYFRVPYIYPYRYAFSSSPHPVVTLACACHSFHYAKRLVETVFVHRFSRGTMPLGTIVRNCAYYWGFSAWLAYYINHPLYTPPSYGQPQVNAALLTFVMCELGNFSIHLTLNNLRGEGSRSRRYPTPTKNPFTWLFVFVSCPNYTYEVGVWVSFAVMTQCAPDDHLGQGKAQGLQQVQGLPRPSDGYNPPGLVTAVEAGAVQESPSVRGGTTVTRILNHAWIPPHVSDNLTKGSCTSEL